jgi:hypothetical protein
VEGRIVNAAPVEGKDEGGEFGMEEVVVLTCG